MSIDLDQLLSLSSVMGHAEVSSALVALLASSMPGVIYPRSIAVGRDHLYCLLSNGTRKRLVVISRLGASSALSGVTHSAIQLDGHSYQLSVAQLDAGTAQYMRQQLPWLGPTVLGRSKSVGCGDRLGLATPGHVRAVRACPSSMAPIFAQQSIREMTRTQRTPQQVIDDAMWGVLQEGWSAGYGADADHLKTIEDIDRCVAAGFTFYTFDPGAYVDNTFEPERFSALPWPALETTATDLLSRYRERFDAGTIQQAVVKYGRAIAHVTMLYRYVKQAMAGHPFEVEVSVDETEQPTTVAEHFIIAGELRRLGVEWVSLAPRFVGRFEKGVDYIGDLNTFETDFAQHVHVMREWGPYKLSLHSGSDKFSIYPIVSRLAGEYVHLKTAGTSYLEALRTVARCDPRLFQRVYALAYERYNEDRASYHVSADLARAPQPDLHGVTDIQSLLDQFDARQMLHVCFGSILARYGQEIKAVVAQNEEAHYSDLEHHFERHLHSFCY
jgi:hypothetical protein